MRQNILNWNCFIRIFSSGHRPSCTPQCTASTPSVTYTYDRDYRGALSSVCVLSCTPASSTVIDTFTHDGLGRVIGSGQQIGTNSAYAFSYGYSLTDQLTQITYPASVAYPNGHTINYGLDASDRVQSATNASTQSNYATLNYTTDPNNTLTITMGNGVKEQPSFNDRLQPIGLQAASSSAGSLLQLGLYPCTGPATSCTTGNVGNLMAQSITLPGYSVTQTYSYDNLNRLTSAAESGSGWNQSYQYDNFGNRWVPASNGLPPLSTETLQSNGYNSQNQVNTWTYDNNGNVVTIPIVNSQSRNFTYDAEDRTVSATIVTGTGTISASYLYDGLGQRVSKTVNGATTTFAYDAFGNLAAEYGATQSPCDTSTCYLTVDHLGSTRLLTDSNGSSTVTRYDYQPFGAEITATYGGRTTGMGYAMAPDTMGPKYTGQYRDTETTMDWFEVRHLSGAQGRYQSVDPGNAGADPSDPQTWNGYAYVGNNPLSYTDPSGMYAAAGGGDGGGAFGAVAGLIVDGFTDLINSLTGGSGPPALANFPFPNQVPNSTPYAFAGGLVFQDDVFDFANDYLAGVADSASFDWTRKTRLRRGLQDPNYSGWVYKAGYWTPAAVGGAEVAVGGVRFLSSLPKMTVAVGRGALSASPIHVAFKVGDQWMHAYGGRLFGMKITGKFAARFAEEAPLQFKVPILSPTAVEGLEGAKSWSCVTGAIRAFFTGWWLGGC